jgi:hypothetical protein
MCAAAPRHISRLLQPHPTPPHHTAPHACLLSLTLLAARCVEAGATRVVVAPYFLSKGRHIQDDIPALVAEAQQQFPGITCTIAEPIGEGAGWQGSMSLQWADRQGALLPAGHWEGAHRLLVLAPPCAGARLIRLGSGWADGARAPASTNGCDRAAAAAAATQAGMGCLLLAGQAAAWRQRGQCRCRRSIVLFLHAVQPRQKTTISFQMTPAFVGSADERSSVLTAGLL